MDYSDGPFRTKCNAQSYCVIVLMLSRVIVLRIYIAVPYAINFTAHYGAVVPCRAVPLLPRTVVPDMPCIAAHRCAGYAMPCRICRAVPLFLNFAAHRGAGYAVPCRICRMSCRYFLIPCRAPRCRICRAVPYMSIVCRAVYLHVVLAVTESHRQRTR